MEALKVQTFKPCFPVSALGAVNSVNGTVAFNTPSLYKILFAFARPRFIALAGVPKSD
jgi:hypothetical protein